MTVFYVKFNTRNTMSELEEWEAHVIAKDVEQAEAVIRGRFTQKVTEFKATVVDTTVARIFMCREIATY